MKNLHFKFSCLILWCFTKVLIQKLQFSKRKFQLPEETSNIHQYSNYYQLEKYFTRTANLHQYNGMSFFLVHQFIAIKACIPQTLFKILSYLFNFNHLKLYSSYNT